MAIEDIAVQSVATLLGVLVGIPTAFWLDRRITAGHEKEKAKAVLTALKAEIKHNLELLKQMQREFTMAPVVILYYNMRARKKQTTTIISPDDFDSLNSILIS
jgi:hypothetical protein